MPNTHTESGRLSVIRWESAEKSARELLFITGTDTKNMDIESIHSLYSTLRLCTVRLQAEILRRAKSV